MRFSEARFKALAQFEEAVEKLRVYISSPEWLGDEDEFNFSQAMGELGDAATLLGRINGVALEVGAAPEDPTPAADRRFFDTVTVAGCRWEASKGAFGISDLLYVFDGDSVIGNAADLDEDNRDALGGEMVRRWKAFQAGEIAR